MSQFILIDWEIKCPVPLKNKWASKMVYLTNRNPKLSIHYKETRGINLKPDLVQFFSESREVC